MKDSSCQWLDMIEVTIHEWFYSDKLGKLYRYDQSVIEAYAALTSQPSLRPTSPVKMYTHHKLKVLAEDAVSTEATITDTHIHLDKCLAPCELWRGGTNIKELDQLIIA